MSLQTESTIISATLGAFNRPYKTTFLFNSLAGLLKKIFQFINKRNCEDKNGAELDVINNGAKEGHEKL